jgi:hypothetical protein
MAQINAQLHNIDAQEAFDILPPGDYPATVVDSEIKMGSKGQYINWTWAVDGKPNRVWDTMSLASEVSMKRLKSMATCCGHKNPNYIADTEELHGFKCILRLKIEKDETGQYADKNKIAGFKPILKAAPSATAQAAPAAQPSAAPNAAKMPWEA